MKTKENKVSKQQKDIKDSILYKRRNVFLLMLSSLFIFTLVATVGSTFAWYQYATKAGLSFSGQVIGDNDNIEIGVFSDKELPDCEKYNFVKDENIEHLYWHYGDLDDNIISYYSKHNNYATNYITPVTSGAYSENDELKLKGTPNSLMSYEDTRVANTFNYLRLPLAFRTKKPETDYYHSNYRVTIKDAYAYGEGEIPKTLRMHIDFGKDNRFIINPQADVSGFDVVGGPLDLDQNGYYDYTMDTNEEFLYGQAKDVKYLPALEKDDGPEQRDGSSFTSNSKEGIKRIDKEKSIFENANYLCVNDVINQKFLTESSFDNTPQEQFNYIKTCVVTIYLEGWSLSCIDRELFNNINFALSFTIDEMDGK